jgi:hypothetical protein
MADIILTTLNARYAHCAFGLRYLMANLGELQARARMLEFDINQRPVDVVEAVLRHEPRIVGLGVYIWNATQSLQLVADLKRLRPGPHCRRAGCLPVRRSSSCSEGGSCRYPAVSILP